jgi:hypothetical protein
MDFHPFTPFDNNAAQNKVWDWLKQAFRQDEGVAYYRYPIFRRIGQLQREPDILLLHRELGLWVIECKGCYIRNIVSIQGHDWTMQEWHSESEAPIAQVEDQMFAVQNKLTERRETRGLVSCNFRVALPFVRREEWQDRKFDANPVTQGTVLVYEDLTPAALRKNLTEAAQCHPQRSLTNEQWELIKGVLGGTLPNVQPREIPSGTSTENPVRVIHTIQSQIRMLDEQQQKIAFEIPPGPQRIRPAV